MTDFHSHVLPEMDDGSRSVEESLEMLAMSWQQGVRHMAATPHFYAEENSPEEFLKRRAVSAEKLQKAVEGRENLPILHLGAEVRYYEGFSQTQSLEKLKIQGTDLLLLEMPFAPWTERMFREIRNAQQRLGCTVVLAHIERYLHDQTISGFWDRVEESGALVQANGEFFLTRFQKRKAYLLFKQGRIHLLGSDCHGRKHRPPNLGEAAAGIQSRLGPEALAELGEREKQLPRN